MTAPDQPSYDGPDPLWANYDVPIPDQADSIDKVVGEILRTFDSDMRSARIDNYGEHIINAKETAEKGAKAALTHLIAQEANKAELRLLLDLEQAAMEAHDLAALEFIVGRLKTSRTKLVKHH